MVRNLATQLSWCYKINRKLKNPSNIWFCDMDQRMKDNLNRAYDGYDKWDVNYFDQSFDKIGASENENETQHKPEIVYLSSDSENVITKFDKGSIYVIGGLVDRNAHKNFTHEKATKMNLKTAKLPLAEFYNFEEIKRPLTVNHVCEIICKVNNRVMENSSWAEQELNFDNSAYKEVWRDAIESTLPQRKNLKAKVAEVSESNELGKNDSSSTQKSES